MLATIAVIAALLGLLAISIALAVRVLKLEASVLALHDSQRRASSSLETGASDTPRPLEGLQIALAITQDHPHPIFADILSEHLLAEDVSVVHLLNPEQSQHLLSDWSDPENDPDILIEGDVHSNGYAEVYYTAELSCRSAGKTLCTLIEKPPHGDRPSNLALELVSRLKKELLKQTSRDERRTAIRELQGP